MLVLLTSRPQQGLSLDQGYAGSQEVGKSGTDGKMPIMDKETKEAVIPLGRLQTSNLTIKSCTVSFDLIIGGFAR